MDSSTNWDAFRKALLDALARRLPSAPCTTLRARYVIAGVEEAARRAELAPSLDASYGLALAGMAPGVYATCWCRGARCSSAADFRVALGELTLQGPRLGQSRKTQGDPGDRGYPLRLGAMKMESCAVQKHHPSVQT